MIQYACSSSGLIYYGPANWSFGRQIPCANYFIIIYCEVFLFFSESVFPKVVFSLRSGARSERCSVISGALQASVKISKKYMKVNPFLILSCSLQK